MSDLTKLKKQVHKATEAVEARKLELYEAAERFGAAERELGGARAALEEAEALEMARELRANSKTRGA